MHPAVSRAPGCLLWNAMAHLRFQCSSRVPRQDLSFALRSVAACMAMAFLLTATIPALQAEPSQTDLFLYAVKIQGDWGFIDQGGELVIPARFGSARAFHEGLAAVEMGVKVERVVRDHTESTWGFIDTHGEMVIEATYEWVGDFHEGLASVRVEGRYGFIDREGKLVIPTAWPGRVGHFSQGRAFVELGREQLGYLKPDGELAFTLEGVDTSGPRHFSEGRVRVETADGELRFHDRDGKLVLNLGEVFVRSFQEGLAVARVDRKWGFIDASGAFVIEPIYSFAQGFRNGLAIVTTKDPGPRYINPQGEVAVPTKGMEDLSNFSEGLALVRDAESGKYGYIDRTGAWVIPAQWEDPMTSASLFRGGLAAVGVREKDRRGKKVLHRLFIDRKGKVVFDPRENQGTDH